MAGANTLGEYNPNGSAALGLTPDAEPSTILASLVDPFLGVVFPPFVTSLTDPITFNVPLRDTATIIAGDATTRGVLPFIEDAVATDRSIAAPNSPDPITLEDWFKASGRMLIHCRNEDSAFVNIRVRNL